MLTFLVLLVLIGGIYLLQSMLYTRHGMDAVSYRCYFDKEEVTEGESVHLIEEIENRKFLPLPWLKAEFSVSKYLEFAGTHSVITDRTRFVSSFFSLKSYSRIRREWEVTCTRRGEYRVDRVLLVTGDLLGAARTSAAASETSGLLTVLPRCYEACGDLLAQCTIAIGERPVQYSLFTDPFSIAGSREYTGREPLRRMDWKASARTGTWMVRQEEPSQQRELAIAFTAQTGEFGRRYVNEDASEHTIRVCARLFRECVLRQQPFSVCSPCTVEGNPYSAPASCTPRHYEMLLHDLAALETTPADTLDHCVPALRDTQLVIVTPYISEDVHRLLHRFPGAVVFLTARGEHHGVACIPVYEEVPHA